MLTAALPGMSDGEPSGRCWRNDAVANEDCQLIDDFIGDTGELAQPDWKRFIRLAANRNTPTVSSEASYNPDDAAVPRPAGRVAEEGESGGKLDDHAGHGSNSIDDDAGWRELGAPWLERAHGQLIGMRLRRCSGGLVIALDGMPAKRIPIEGPAGRPETDDAAIRDFSREIDIELSTEHEAEDAPPRQRARKGGFACSERSLSAEFLNAASYGTGVATSGNQFLVGDAMRIGEPWLLLHIRWGYD
ncbi:hypothetical protein AX289_28635 [Methylorubrum populi]|nr:hypothetical protein AX289_28635 [Methylorubrum populi]